MRKIAFHNLRRFPFQRVTFFLILMMVSFSPRVSNAAPGAITNPLEAKSLVGLLDAFVQILVQFGIPIAAVAIIYSGFLFVTARGNEQKITKAKEAFYWAIIGSVILLGARIIIGVVAGTIGGITVP